MAALMESVMSSWWVKNEGPQMRMENNPVSQFAKSPRIKNVVSGTCGGISLVAVGHPFDTLKVKLQMQCSRAPLYSGAVDCMKQTMKMEGFNGLYKGISSPLVGQMFNNALLFMTYDEIRTAMMARNGGLPLSTGQTFVAGGLTGAVVALVESPADLFKSKMQLQASASTASSVQFSSTLDCVRHITERFGIRGWYQGFWGTALRNCAGNALFFSIYDLTLKHIDVNGERSVPALFAAGATAGFGFTTFVYPLDTIKTTLMADAMCRRERQYRGVIDCARQLYAQQGWRAFMKGLAPSLVRATPGCGMLVVTVEGVKRLMDAC